MQNDPSPFFRIAVVLFPGFELLDVFGPLEMFGILSEHFSIHLLAEKAGEVRSSQGPRSVVDFTFSEKSHYDILLIPGGMGTRKEVHNPVMMDWLQSHSVSAKFVSSVCTGSALLAKAGVLDGIKATSNKKAFKWVREQGGKVIWQEKARWVADGKYWTSSGVSAGIDMTLALIAKILGSETAEMVANHTEYEWHRDPNWDPFAALYGLG